MYFLIAILSFAFNPVLTPGYLPQMEVRAYDVTDMFLFFNVDDSPPVDLRQMTTPQRKKKEDFRKRIKLQIEQAIECLEPASWKTNGGKGTIFWMNNVLIIRNTTEVHELLDGAFSF